MIEINVLRRLWKEHISQATGKEKTSMALEKGWNLKVEEKPFLEDEAKEEKN